MWRPRAEDGEACVVERCGAGSPDALARLYTLDRHGLPLIATRCGDTSRLGFEHQLILCAIPASACQSRWRRGSADHLSRRAARDRAVGFAALSGRSREAQEYRASGLNLVIAAIVYWNSTCMADAVAHLRRNGEPATDRLLPHTSPVQWEHIGFAGDFLLDRAAKLPSDRCPLNLPRERTLMMRSRLVQLGVPPTLCPPKVCATLSCVGRRACRAIASAAATFIASLICVVPTSSPPKDIGKTQHTGNLIGEI